MIGFVGIIVITKDNKLALQKRDNKPGIQNPGKVAIWGGGVEKGEKPIQAAIRELEEELTITVKQKQLKLFLSFKNYSTFFKEDLSSYNFILKNVEAKDLKIQEGEKIIYIEPKLAEVKKLSLGPTSKKVLFEYLKNS